jgi:hypothetical protein
MAKKSESLPDAVTQFTLDLIQDLKDLRAGKITPRDAKARAILAHEVLRSVHLQFEGMKYLAGAAKQISESK